MVYEMINRVIVCTKCLNAFTYKEEIERILDGVICNLPDVCPLCDKKDWAVVGNWVKVE